MSSSNLISVEGVEMHHQISPGEALLLHRAFAPHNIYHVPNTPTSNLIQSKKNSIYPNQDSSIASVLSTYPFLKSIFKLNPRFAYLILDHPTIFRIFRSNPHLLELLTTSFYFLKLFVYDPNLFLKHISNLGLLKKLNHNEEIAPDYALRNKPAFNAVNPAVINLLKNYQPKEGMLLSKEQIISRSNLSPFSRAKEGNKILEREFNIEYKSEQGNIIPGSKSTVKTPRIPNLLTNKIMQQENISNLRNYAALFTNPIFLAYAGAAAITTNKGKIVDEKINEPAQELREPFELEKVHEVVETEFETIVR